MDAENKKGAVAFHSVGCRTNQEEVASLQNVFTSAGYSVVSQIETADLIIVNTCSVTSCTESKTKRFLRSIPRSAPRAQILVTGCLAQQLKDELTDYENVKWVVGNVEKGSILPIIENGRVGLHCKNIYASDTIFLSTVVLPPEHSKRTRFSLKIQEGCNFCCSYCIVPALRGPSRSSDLNNLVAVLKKAVRYGYKEIVLTGTHIGQYRDPATGTSLSGLIEEISEVDGDYRIRLSSLDPRDLTDELLETVAKEGKICDHIHVSVQSFSKDVLLGMGRPFEGVNDLKIKIKRLREKRPDISLGGDFIVGFPGETDHMFMETVNGIRELEFSYGHVFRYSPRPGTKAQKFDNQVTEKLKSQRGELLREELNHSRLNFLSKQKERHHRILVESKGPVRGVTSNYIRVELPGKSAEHNSWIEVKLTELCCKGRCLAEPVK
ncbi:tRNA (N(6)-L-threonylcarbamoyladenosine(37)-C(2))-methylthiotransferase MtaB [Chitinispirillales bacterium ANBcel5]|uniref:tRNA (N(6)-L-threonylcarbamoyladenosine(37)-C(2))- methylthiotransferase MtaB n=1 Tax=Cellulosispirillum alkaliphilum TaxID=3039283 RepID=UPI002A534F8D|nr:tRNA (N(6)-L-threonylcarbamoyladenosine(37)-C(2))-methylthiotransferase MtaB [Chitinispirillales bacterium ANBcel5]